MSDNEAATEQARQTLIEYHQLLLAQLQHERARTSPDDETLAELEEHQQEVLREQESLTPAVIKKALTVYAPFLQAMQ
ncbi:hypothetical protein ACO0LO_08235 [Undibacterium sp. TJN25]|uniref:hypothetical protein n=1 Tax=Undibacterium sp. TJN25 TaxID=3413056 RepID=UPI003BF230B4